MSSREIYEQNAVLLRAVSHPVRLCIVRLIAKNGECNVSSLECSAKASQSSVSQHLAKLKAAGVIKGRRLGSEVYYSLDSKKIKEIVDILFGEEETQERGRRIQSGIL